LKFEDGGCLMSDLRIVELRIPLQDEGSIKHIVYSKNNKAPVV
jgi:hypothetical protein